MLDLFITLQSSVIKSVSQGEFFSDHCFINALLHLDCPTPKPKTVSYRKLKGINTIEFNKDIMDAFLSWDQPSSLSDHVQSYNTILSDVLDKHAQKKLNILVTPIINHGSMIKSRQKSSCIIKRENLAV